MNKQFICGLSALLLIIATSPVLADNDETITGKKEFTEYCAGCHGVDGKGNGPKSLKTDKPPRDLTRLSIANGGKFPYSRVRSVIDGRVAEGKDNSAHIKGGMPVWGDVFASEKGSSAGSRMHGEAVAKMRILNIVDYLAAIQEDGE